MKSAILFCLSVCVLAGCASKTALPEINYTSVSCRKVGDFQYKPAQTQLDQISEFFHRGCYQEVIAWGSYVRKIRRDKFYNVTAEAGEIFLPDGSLTEYTLESYERAYLSILISMSYLNLNQENDALVELRKSGEEERAVIYNYGTDPVMALLAAAIWDRFDPMTARPYWKYLTESKKVTAELHQVATARLAEIDQSPSTKVPWKIAAIGSFPKLDWTSNYLKSSTQGPYIIKPASPFPYGCSTPTSIVMPTETWVEKIGMKYSPGYHPLMMAKAAARLPVGLAYGAIGTVTGAAVGVGGCVVAGQLGSNGNSQGVGQMCEASVYAGGMIIAKSIDVAGYTLAPDLRHWSKLPRAFWIMRPNPSSEDLRSCVASTDADMPRDSMLIQ